MPEPARFVRGPILRHVVVMASTGSVGLMAVFLVDFLSLLYVSWLGDPRLTAAVGFATIVQVFAISITIGTMIAVGALVSRALGRDDVAGARRIAASSLVISGIAGGLSVVVLLAGLEPLLRLIGAGPESAPAAARFLWIALPANVAMALGLGCSGVLRAVGDARRAMAVTLAGAAVTAVLDPVLIFGLGLGVEGAAIAAAASRLAFAAVGWHGAVRVHRMVAPPTWAALRDDARPVLRIALPAVLTNLAPPVASAFLAHVVARYGTAAVAGNAVIDRLVPVAFGGLFALSGAVGPILGPELGCRPLRPHAPHPARRRPRHGPLHAGGVGRAGPRPPRHRAAVPPGRGRGRPADLLLPRRRRRVVLQRAAVRRQRRLQQPRRAAPLDRLQLGAARPSARCRSPGPAPASAAPRARWRASPSGR